MSSFTFGAFRLSTDTGTLCRGEEPVELSGKLWDVLHVLVQHPGELFAPEDLATAAWPDAPASSDTVGRTVRRLRLALGDPPDSPLYIEVVHGRGFRFIAPVRYTSQSSDGGDSFVGRGTELAALHALQSQARTSGARVALVMGDAGIGKTALIHRFLDELGGDAGVRVGHAVCIETTGNPEPFAPLLTVFEEWLAADDDTARRVILERAPTWARELRLTSDLPSGTDSGSLERMPREGLAVLVALARERPTVLVIDEAGWADAATISVLDALTRRRERVPLLIVCAARRAEVALTKLPFNILYGASADPSRVARLDLGPLDDEAIGHLLHKRAIASTGASRLRSVLSDLSGGHPLLASCLIEDWRCRGLVDEIASGRMQPDVANAVDSSHALAISVLLERRLEMLDANAQRAVEVASVAGNQFDVREVAAATDDDGLEDLFHDLARLEFLIEPGSNTVWPDGTSGWTYRFRHALLRAPLLERVPASRRSRWVRAILERLETGHGAELGAVLSRLLAHSHELGDLGRILKYEGVAATNALRRLNPGIAAEHLLRALAAADRIPSVEPKARGSLALGAAASIFHGPGVGDARIEPLLERAHAEARSAGAVGLEYRATLVASGYWMRRGLLAESKASCDRMMELAGAHGDALKPAAYLYRGLAHLIAGEAVRAQEDFAASITMPTDPSLMAGVCFERMARMYHAVVLTWQGYLTAAQAAFAAAQAAAEREGNAFDATDLAYFRALVAVRLGRRKDVLAECAKVLSLDAEHGFPRHVPGASLMRDWARTAETAAKSAAVRMRDVLERRRETGEQWDDTFYSFLCADVWLSAGDHAEAGRINEAAREWAMQNHERCFLSDLLRQAGRIALAGGGAARLREARVAFRKAMTLAREQDAACAESAAAEQLAGCGLLSAEDERDIASARRRFEERREALSPLAGATPMSGVA